MKLFTIGFTKKSAEKFFTMLSDAGVKRVIDIRLNNTSQLAGFAKKDDLQFFLKKIGGIEYVHLAELAPTKDIIDEFKKHGGSWETYEKKFRTLLSARRVEETIAKAILDSGCLLCSEEIPAKCHRRLAAEYFKKRWPDIEIEHLV
jgi:uncharacterized protein (DUF488 family)